MLGMLAYHLDLRPDQITTLDAAADDRTLFAIDDCCLSGTRFRESLNRIATHSVVFCPLYAPEALCSSIASREPRVVNCLPGASLRDTSPTPDDAGYSAWKHQRLSRLVADDYWLGQPLGVAFSWCTPQTRRWDETEGRFMEGWDVVPPSRCLKRRLLLRRLEHDAAVDYLPPLTLNTPHSDTGIRAGGRVLWCRQDAGVVVAKVPQRAGDTASVYGLDTISSELWQMLMLHGSMQHAIQVLLTRYHVASERLWADMSSLVEQMRSEGLIVQCDGIPQGGGPVASSGRGSSD
ncbi:hypothetical protein Q427_17095 [Halomonas sp. BC04]|nr:hypothetical protein Q427_17095 [Halomonas sp. BC04]